MNDQIADPVDPFFMRDVWILVFLLVAGLIACILSAWLALLISSRKIAEVSLLRAVAVAVLIFLAGQLVISVLLYLVPKSVAGLLASALTAWVVFTMYHAEFRKPDHPGLKTLRSQALAAIPTTILYCVFQTVLFALINLGVSQLTG